MTAAARPERVLALETSSPLVGVAILEDGKTLAEAAFDTRTSRSEMLLAEARRLLEEEGLAVGDLTFIAYSAGPGSFTGLRVGMASALGLAAGAGLPVVEVPTLEVLAFPWRGLGETIVCLSGRRRGQLYFAAYRWSGERFDILAPPSAIREESLPERTRELPGERLLFVGDALDSLPPAIGALCGERAVVLPSASPRAAHVAQLARDPLRPRWTGKEIEGRSPIYLREADARRPEQPGPSQRR
jgi:tRNA threonylcarbamoyladenosine biosynthesis protein TsaB